MELKPSSKVTDSLSKHAMRFHVTSPTPNDVHVYCDSAIGRTYSGGSDDHISCLLLTSVADTTLSAGAAQYPTRVGMTDTL